MSILHQLRTLDRATRILLINDLAMFLGFFMLYPFVAGYLTGSLGFPTWQVGVILGVRVFCQQGLQVLGGSLADRIGYKPVIIAGFALRTVGFALFGLLTSFGGILAAAVLSGLAGALFSPALRAFLSTEQEPSRRAEVFALDNVVSQLGTFAGPLIGAVLIGISFPLLCVLAASIFGLLGLAQLRYLPNRIPTARNESFLADWREVLANRSFVLFACSLFGYFALFNQLYLALPIEAKRLTGTDTTVSLIFLLSALLIVLLQLPIIGWWNRHGSTAGGLTAGMVVMGIAFVPPIVAGPWLPVAGEGLVTFLINASPVLAATALLAVGSMLIRPLSQDLIPVLARERLVGTYNGFFWMASDISSALGTTVAGSLFDTADGSALPWFVLTAVGLVSAVAVGLLQRGGRLVG